MFSLIKYKTFSLSPAATYFTEIKACNPVSVAQLMMRSSRPSLLLHAVDEL